GSLQAPRHPRDHQQGRDLYDKWPGKGRQDRLEGGRESQFAQPATSTLGRYRTAGHRRRQLEDRRDARQWREGHLRREGQGGGAADQFAHSRHRSDGDRSVTVTGWTSKEEKFTRGEPRRSFD